MIATLVYDIETRLCFLEVNGERISNVFIDPEKVQHDKVREIDDFIKRIPLVAVLPETETFEVRDAIFSGKLDVYSKYSFL